MSNEFHEKSDLSQPLAQPLSAQPLSVEPLSAEPMVYQIRIKGHLGGQWAEWFAEMTITQELNGDSLLTGEVVDQAALFGLLRKVRDLGLPLLSVIGLAEEDIQEEEQEESV
jgi:hypothetical protein